MQRGKKQVSADFRSHLVLLKSYQSGAAANIEMNRPVSTKCYSTLIRALTFPLFRFRLRLLKMLFQLFFDVFFVKTLYKGLHRIRSGRRHRQPLGLLLGLMVGRARCREGWRGNLRFQLRDRRVEVA